MPQPDRLLATIQQAVQAFRHTPGRRGHVVVLPPQGDVLVGGDLHGNLENFRLLLQHADLAKNPQRHLVLQELIHGSFHYSTGGDKSHQLLDLTAALKCQFPERVHFLLGNHELAQWHRQLIGKGNEDLNNSFNEGVDTAYGVHGEAIANAYLELFAASNLAIRTPNRVFLCHSLPSPRHLDQFDPAVLANEDWRQEDLVWGGAIHSLLWGRETRPDHVAAFLAKVDADWLISGHIPCDQGYLVPNDRHIILDCMGHPACYCLLPLDRPVTQPDLLAGMGTL